MTKVKELSNGLKIVVEEMPYMSSAAVGVWVNVGGRYESEENAGIAHFIEHMLFRGTKTRTCQQIKEEIEGVGGYLNAFTSEEFTCYYSKVIGQEYKNAMKVLVDLVKNPLFDNKDILHETAVIIEEIKMYEDIPSHYVHDLLDVIMWKEHPLGLLLTGTQETVSSIKKEKLFEFFKKYYAASNIVVSCAGNVNFDEIVQDTEVLFNDLDKGNPDPFVVFSEKQEQPEFKVYNRDTEQTHIAIGIKSLKRRHDLKYALGILNTILGGNMSSRLFKEIREERGLVYEIRSSMSRYYDTGVFEISAGMEHERLIETLEVVLGELRIIREIDVPADEFQRAKKYYIGGYLMHLEKTTDRMLNIGEKVMTDTLDTPEKIIDDINKVNISDVKKAACEIFQNNKLNLAIIGQQENESKIEEVFRL